jgi:uncharacterized protein (TIGR04255 family)
MGNDKLILRNPPLNQVRAEVGFRNALEVADCRSKFHRLVEKDFPLVVMPDHSKLKYDFGDYSLHSENFANRLEIGMNYFRLVTTNYGGFTQFRSTLEESLSKFSKCYGIESFLQFSITYDNQLPLNGEWKFGNCFSIQISVSHGEQPLFAGKGVMIFEQPEGYVSVEIDPHVELEKVTSYNFLLGFFCQRQLSYSADKDDLSPLLGTAHGYIERYFDSILEPQYQAYLKSK